MAVPDSIQKLVEKFERDAHVFRDPNYTEENVRVGFINPFFKALGWDVENSALVVHEDRVIVDDGLRKRVKHPDYGFRTGRDVRFYVEAKKPAVNLASDAEPAYQVRRYGWSKKLPLSILTDFEEFIIYNCLEQPDRKDGAHVARLKMLSYGQYIEEWENLYSLLSYEAVLDGALERYVEAEKPRGMITVDEAFLREMEAWRESLAKDIALLNRDLSRRELNMAVQNTIDRLVFLRICEDRNIEPYGRLSRAAGNRANVYEELKALFQQANDKYNSGLFHFGDAKDETADSVSLRMQVSDEPLQKIINRLYYPNSPYEFSVLPADILGQVYERFLGKVIVLSSGGQAEIEEKPEVRKAGGVYYTPTYIVDYIVKNTVGKLLEKKNPNQVDSLRILDPACGSGSFLIGAYQYLLDWHLDYYVTKQQKTALKDKKIRETQDPSQPFALTSQEKKRILLNNIYGVDLDQQAVEVTKLSLLLKMLEDETDSSARQFTLLATDERILPDLADNIKWGNSLIGTDFYSGKQLGLFGDEELYRVKAFDWETEFKGIMDAGGFDAVIGNPPYIRIQVMRETAPETVPYYSQHYQSATRGNYDIYVVFVERGLKLLNQAGRLGYILPHKFFNAKYGEPIRGIIAQGKNLAHIVHFGDQQVFEGATTYTCLMFLDKASRKEFEYIEVANLLEWRTNQVSQKGLISLEGISASDWNFIVSNLGNVLFHKLQSMPVNLKAIAERMSQGVRTSANSIYVLDEIENNGISVKAQSQSLGKEVYLEKSIILNFLQGREIKPYQVLPSGKVIIMPYQFQGRQAVLMPSDKVQKEYPQAWAYLNDNKTQLEARERGRFKGDEWYVYGRNQNIDLMLVPKILVPDIANRASFALDEKGDYAFTSGYGITLKSTVKENIKYVLGLLNSKVLDFYLKQVSTTIRGGYFRYFTQFIEQLPIRTIDFENAAEKAQHDNLVALVETILDLQKQVSEASGAAKSLLEKQIAKTDNDIDKLVYELYGLTAEEIAIVEGQ